MYGFNYVTLLALAAGTAATSVSTTPHDSYSSSVGVLGCKIDTNRVAYWPGSVDCNNICIKLSYGDRSVNLLRIDQSGGAHDISYDAWAYLQTGESATVDAISGGGVDMEYEEVDASECADLILTDGSKLPLSASNSMNFVTSCLAEPDSWVAQNHVLYNICDAICTLGYDETCTLDLATSNQPSCAHTLGLTTTLTSAPVHNIEYQSGKVVVAGSGAVASGYSYAEAGADSETEATSFATPAASIPTTSVDAVFLEVATSSSTSVQEYSTAKLVTSSSTSVQEYSTAELVTSSSTSVQEYNTAPATTTSASTTSTFVPASSIQSTTAAQTSKLLASSSATTLISSVQSYTATSTGSFATSTVSASTNGSSTLLVATRSSSRSSPSSTSSSTSRSSSSSSSSAATSTSQPSASGNSKIRIPVSALLSSLAIYLLTSAL
ncbi:hypothetical protein SCUP234_05252 [Seiridium cupressi]